MGLTARHSLASHPAAKPQRYAPYQTFLAKLLELMRPTSETGAFKRGVRPIMEIVSPAEAEKIIEFRPDPELQARIDELASKSTEGQLTEAERAEYVGYVRANKFVAILQRQARRLIEPRS
jgi:hypothetical protein